jgi:hypothetical protein
MLPTAYIFFSPVCGTDHGEGNKLAVIVKRHSPTDKELKIKF